MQDGQSAQMGLVDQDVFPRMLEAPLGLPVEIRIGDNGFRHRGRGILRIWMQVSLSEVMAETRVIPVHFSSDFKDITIEKLLCRIAKMACLWFPRPSDAVAIELARWDARQKTVTDAALPIGMFGAEDLFLSARVKEHQFNRRGMIEEKRDIRPFAIKLRAEAHCWSAA